MSLVSTILAKWSDFINAGTSNPQPFIYSGGSFTLVNIPGSTASGAYGINNAGQIVGTYEDPTGTHGFVASAVPEPCSLFLVGSSLAVAAGAVARRRHM
jgi:hypothetical protein